jgi:hypothetical protein
MTDVSVEVLHDGRWYSGWLEAVRRDEDGWRGFVRFTAGADATHLLWFGEAEVRRPKTPR